MGRNHEPVLKGFYHYGSVDRLYLLHSPNNDEDNFADKARDLQMRLAAAGFNGVQLKEIDAFDMNSIINAILSVVEVEKPPFYINITGGTNMMAGAACAASFFVGAKAYYVLGKKGEDLSQYKVIELPVPNIPYYREISKPQLSVLKTLSEIGGESTNQELRYKLDISPQILSYHVKELESKGLIEIDSGGQGFHTTDSRIKNYDRRVRIIRMTNAGSLVLRWTLNSRFLGF
jgi:CRISPR locus-related DNA-binding protein